MRDEVELFDGPEAIFGCRHLAAEPPDRPVGVLVCSSVGADAAAFYGAEARLGRVLARAGVATQRFHYRGTGASDGAPDELSFITMVADARAALERLRTCVAPVAVGVVGVRLGALVAARLAASLDGAPVALWSPVADARPVLEAAARARAAHHPVLDRAPFADLHPDVDGGREGWTADHRAASDLDLFDLPLAADLIEGVVVGSLVDELRGCSGEVLLVGTAAGPVATERARSLVERCRAAGLRVDAATVPRHEENDGVPTPIADAGPLVDHTARWLAARLAPATPADADASPSGSQTGTPAASPAGSPAEVPSDHFREISP